MAGATRGHYAVIKAVLQLVTLADAAATTEVHGLTNTQSKPADILTSTAVPGRRAALDVCVASPNAAAAAGDAAEAAFRRKLRRYRRDPQLRAAGIVFRPLVWTSNGRPHPAVTRTLRFVAEPAAHRTDEQTEATRLLARSRHEIQVAILRRRAAMVRAVMPRLLAVDSTLLTGRADGVPHSLVRAPALPNADAAEAAADENGRSDAPDD